MSVSLYYGATRATPLTPDETRRVSEIVQRHQTDFPYEDDERLHLYEPDERTPEQVLAGSTKLPEDPARMLNVVGHVLDAVSDLRRALADAAWRVHVDDHDVEWHEEGGYGLPGMRDSRLISQLASAEEQEDDV